MSSGIHDRIRLVHPGDVPSGSQADLESQTDLIIAALAARQRGRVARRQLLAAGIGRGAIARRLELGRLHIVHPGVYAVGHPGGGIEEVLMSAWLYGGPFSVLSHRGAAQDYELGRFEAIDLTAPGSRRPVGRLTFHRGTVADGEWVWRGPIRVTTPARTLLDLCAVVPRPRMQRLFTEAEVLGLIDAAAIRRVIEANPRRHGVRLLRSLAELGPETAPGRIRSRLESRFRRLLAREGFPPPRCNLRLDLGDATFEGDFVWPERRLVVELDGRAAHDNSRRFETDRARDRRLAAHGWRTVRVTQRQLDQPAELLADLHRLLGPSHRSA